MMRVTSTYPKSSREYMSAKKTVQSSSQRWKEGVTERDYGGEGEVSAREERAARMPEQSQPWALLHIFHQRKNDPDMPTEQTQDRRRTERVGGKERGGERTRWGVLQRSKGNARERERRENQRASHVTRADQSSLSAPRIEVPVFEPPRNHFHWVEITC